MISKIIDFLRKLNGINFCRRKLFHFTNLKSGNFLEFSLIVIRNAEDTSNFSDCYDEDEEEEEQTPALKPSEDPFREW